MNPLAIAGAAFGCTIGGALLGMMLHARLPKHHLDGDSKDVVKLVMGLVATMSALVLGLLIASANGSFDRQLSELRRLGANVVELDAVLAQYGPETADSRAQLRRVIAAGIERVWPVTGAGSVGAPPDPALRGFADLYGRIQDLPARTDAQRNNQGRALQIVAGVENTLFLLYEQTGGSVPWPFLVVLVSWLTVLFVGFGLFARPHATVVVAFAVGALAVAAAIFLILEMNQPYSGLMRIPSAPLRGALDQISR